LQGGVEGDPYIIPKTLFAGRGGG